jgi:NAD(P)H:quinone oxidoreductase type IV
MVNVQVVFYSMYGHIYRMALAIADGAREVPDTDVSLFQVPELVPEDILVKSSAKSAKALFAHVPIAVPEQLVEADAIIFGTPTRYGNMCAQMRNFLDQTQGACGRDTTWWVRWQVSSRPLPPSTAGRRPRSPASTGRSCILAWSSWGCLTQSRG